MTHAALALSTLVALLHLSFFAVESFFWQRPTGLKMFRLTPDKARVTAPLAKNQGVYNAFLAAGLLTCLVRGIETPDNRFFLFFFLGCVVVAGLVGAATVSRRILWVQAFPAMLAALATVLAQGPF